MQQYPLRVLGRTMKSPETIFETIDSASSRSSAGLSHDGFTLFVRVIPFALAWTDRKADMVRDCRCF